MGDLKITVSEKRVVSLGKVGHWFPCTLFKLKDGSIVLMYSLGPDGWLNNLAEGIPHAILKSFDNGLNWFLLGIWKQAIGEAVPEAVMEDGTVYGIMQNRLFVKPSGDMYILGSCSKDNMKSWGDPEERRVVFPEGTLEVDYTQQKTVWTTASCYFEGSIMQISDGSFLRLADPLFKGDTYYRVCVLKSVDQGKSWEYLSTIADSNDEPADFDESDFKCLPNGDLFCMMRTDRHEAFRQRKDGDPNPMFQSKSSDGGKTWSKPVYAGVWGVRPKLLLLQNGILACSYGRVDGTPSRGDRIMFSQDNGETWINHTEIYHGRSTGYTSILEVRPNEIMYVYDTLGSWEEKNTIETVNIKVERI